MLPFDADALFGAFAHHHATYWPLQWLALAGGAATIALATAHAPYGTRAILLLLSAAWLWVSVAWHVATFAGINFAAPLYGALFMVEGGLLAWAAMRGRLALRFRHRPRHWVGLGLALAALVGYPAHRPPERRPVGGRTAARRRALPDRAAHAGRVAAGPGPAARGR